jgi:hypothetical protein
MTTHDNLLKMRYLEICAEIHKLRQQGDIGALDCYAVEIASTLDHFRFHCEQKTRECEEWRQEYYKASEEHI